MSEPTPFLSILDQSPIREGGTPAQAIAETRELAQLADALGYRRYWLAEHHASPAFAGAAPEILIGRIAAETQRIRVGSGGIMLSHYSPFKVAEQFRMLTTLFPGRIDLGVGRAPGADPLGSAALQSGPQPWADEDFPGLVGDLAGFVQNALGPDHRFGELVTQPAGAARPEFWVLGSGGDSAGVAAALGCPYVFAHFIRPEAVAAAVARYRAAFRPGLLAVPRVALAVFAIAAESEEEARHLALTRDLWVLSIQARRTIPFPSPERARALITEAPAAEIAAARRRHMAGTGAQVKARLDELADRHGADELLVVSITHDFAARKRSYQLLAEAYGLSSGGGGGGAMR